MFGGCFESDSPSEAVFTSPDQEEAQDLEKSPESVRTPSASQEVRQKSGKTFRLRLTGVPETLDWNLAHTNVETYLLMNLMEGLVEFSEDLKIKPALASRWKVSPDHLTYTFYLKKNVRWSDGKKLRAQDFVFSWKRLLSPRTAASYAYLLFDVKGAKEFYEGKTKDFDRVAIKSLDDFTLQVKLVKPVAHWLSIPTFWATFPLREDIVKVHGTAWSKPGRMVSVGPFMLSSYDFDSSVVLKSNPYYYRDKGNIGEVEAQIIKDDSEALQQFKKGDLDLVTQISTLSFKKLKNDPRFKNEIKTFSYLKTGYLGFNVSRYPVSSVPIRRAIVRAIDKTRIAKTLHGGQIPAHSFTHPRLFSYDAKVGFPFSAREASRELKRSEWDTETKLKLELLCPNWDHFLALAEEIQSDLKKNLEIEIEIRPYDHKTYRNQLDLGGFSLFLAEWGADFPDPDNFLSVFTSSSGNNRTRWKNSSYDQLILKGKSLSSQTQRKKLYQQAEKLLLEKETVILPLYYEPNKALVKSRVKGLVINPLNYIYLRKVNLGL